MNLHEYDLYLPGKTLLIHQGMVSQNLPRTQSLNQFRGSSAFGKHS